MALGPLLDRDMQKSYFVFQFLSIMREHSEYISHNYSRQP